MLLPIITLGIFSNIVYSKIIEKKVNLHTHQMINQIQNSIEYYLESVENIIYYISQTPDVIEYMDAENMTSSDEQEIRLRRSLSVYTESRPEILGILIVNSNDKYISNELEKNNRDPLTNEQWYKAAVNNVGQTQYFSKPVGRNISTYLQYSADEVLSISKAIINPKTNNVMAVVLIDINLKKFEQVIKENYIGEKGFFYIVDKNNDIIYTPINPIIYRIKTNTIDDNSKSVVKTIKGEVFKIMYHTSNITKWKTIGVFSIKDILKDVINMQNFSLIIIVVTLIITILSALLFTNTIVTPLKELSGLMKRAEQGDLDLYFNEGRYEDEIGEVGHSFNHMIKEIKELINMVYKEQSSKRKSEIKILQAQIKPHFLYNTLDTIGWMAEDYGAKDIVEVVGALTKMFRIGLSKGREIIRVKEELDHIKSYMIIQKVRYEDKLSYKIKCDEGLYNASMLKLTTQPIVENAIYHGIKQKRGTGYINISFLSIDNKILIKVEDNGAGIDEDKLCEINYMLENDDMVTVSSETGSGYGIYNVHSRIKLTYGSEYGLKYYSNLNEGTTVEIWLPLLKETIDQSDS